ncbi:MAG: CoB--CoM heterodisulfide reductase subunit C [Candidatus Helarchaeota archaeon]
MLKIKLIKNPNSKFIEEIIEYGRQFFGDDVEKIKACISCGTCTGGCPSSRRTAWRTRMLFRKAQMGMKEEALTDDALWDCTTCYTCQERCIRAIPTTDIVRIIRNIAFAEGKGVQGAHLFVCGILDRFGHAVPINDETKAVRKKIGLKEVPPTVHSYPEGLEEVKTILKETGFADKVKNIQEQKEKEKK